MDYVDCLLIHHPVTSAGEFKAGITPHYFAFGHNADNSFQKVPTIEPLQTIDGDDMQELMVEARMARHRKEGIDFEQAYECRAKTWENFEKAMK